jgi:hypothetical protein
MSLTSQLALGYSCSYNQCIIQQMHIIIQLTQQTPTHFGTKVTSSGSYYNKGV